MDHGPTGDEGHRQPVGFWGTVRDTLFHPRRFFTALDPLGPIGPALLYAVVFAVIAAFGYALEDYLTSLQASPVASPFETLPWYWNLFDWPAMLALEFLYLAWFHLFLRWRGGTSFSFRATFRAYCYTATVNLFCLLPYVGIWIVAFWGIGLVFFAVKTVQRSTWTRVITSWLIANAVLGLAVFGLIFFAGYFRHYFSL